MILHQYLQIQWWELQSKLFWWIPPPEWVLTVVEIERLKCVWRTDFLISFMKNFESPNNIDDNGKDGSFDITQGVLWKKVCLNLKIMIIASKGDWLSNHLWNGMEWWEWAMLIEHSLGDFLVFLDCILSYRINMVIELVSENLNAKIRSCICQICVLLGNNKGPNLPKKITWFAFKVPWAWNS